MDKQAVCKSLSSVLADTYVLMLKTQNVHWNVVGENFLPIHELTETQYTDLFAAVDELAERIRALGGKSPGTMKEFLDLTRLKEGAGGSDWKSMATELRDANLQMADLLRQEIEVVDQIDEDGTEDTYIARLKVHEKAAWMWGAMAGDVPREAKATSNGKSVVKKPEAAKETVKAEKPAQAEKVPVKADKPTSKPGKALLLSAAKTETKKEKPAKKKGRLSRSVSGTG